MAMFMNDGGLGSSSCRQIAERRFADLDCGGRVSLAEHVDDDPAGADVVRGAGVVARVGGGRGVLHGERRSLGVVRHRDAAVRVVVDHALVVVPWVGRLV